MDKIVITGGLGYIGTELCKLYSGYARCKRIIVVDNRFISERVSQLRKWGVEFVHGSILDKELMRNLLGDASLIYHLAGITDVAYTKNQEDPKKNELITEVGVQGTRNIIDFSPKTAKIVFPSSHVVFESGSYQFPIDESIEPSPELTYAKGKYQSEKDILSSGHLFAIARLGSVYGYSTDTMRIGIMPNLFSKIASQNGSISLFSGGVQKKSLVHVIDVCRALMHIQSLDDGIYHVSNENLTVKDIADICHEFRPETKITLTNDEIPNLGYVLDNTKLLQSGFKFRYNIRNAISEMIKNWSAKETPPDEYVYKGVNPFSDDRGVILNYELPEPINLIGLITSKAGSIRANHYHPVQEQKCLLIQGEYISVTKDILKDGPVLVKKIEAGDLSVIQPNVAHAMVFTKDSIFLNLVNGEREHQNYGVTHTIPYMLVDERLAATLTL